MDTQIILNDPASWSGVGEQTLDLPVDWPSVCGGRSIPRVVLHHAHEHRWNVVSSTNAEVLFELIAPAAQGELVALYAGDGRGRAYLMGRAQCTAVSAKLVSPGDDDATAYRS